MYYDKLNKCITINSTKYLIQHKIKRKNAYILENKEALESFYILIFMKKKSLRT